MADVRCETLEEIVAVRRACGDETLQCFRGQADQAWELVPKVHRHLQRLSPPVQVDEFSDLARIERDLYREFERRAHGRAEAMKPWQGLCLAQHHGVPTRLLDWTTSIQTAAYFAVTGEPEKDAAVWVLSAAGLPVSSAIGRLARGTAYRLEAIAGYAPPEKLSFFKVSSHFKAPPHGSPITGAPLPGFLVVIQAPPNPRIERQHGVFSVYVSTEDADLVWNHGGHVRRIEADLGVPLLRRIIIPSHRKPAIRRQLTMEGVDAYQLFPDLEGLSMHLADYLTELTGYFSRDR
jgi:FRG domain